MGEDTLSNEAALHTLDQFARMLQITVDAKQAILAAIQADQVRVNLEKTNANLRSEIAALEKEKAQLNKDLKERQQIFDQTIADTAANARENQEATKKAADATLAKIAAKIKTMEKETAAMEEDRKEQLDALQKKISDAEERLAQANADYSALKDKFKD